MNRAVTVDDLIAVGGEGTAQCQGRIDLLAVLIEVDHAQPVGALDGAAIDRQVTCQHA